MRQPVYALNKPFLDFVLFFWSSLLTIAEVAERGINLYLPLMDRFLSGNRLSKQLPGRARASLGTTLSGGKHPFHLGRRSFPSFCSLHPYWTGGTVEIPPSHTVSITIGLKKKKSAPFKLCKTLCKLCVCVCVRGQNVVRGLCILECAACCLHSVPVRPQGRPAADRGCV